MKKFLALVLGLGLLAVCSGDADARVRRAKVVVRQQVVRQAVVVAPARTVVRIRTR